MANGQQTFSSADQVAYKLLDGQLNSGAGPWVIVPPGLNRKTFHSSSLEEGTLDAEIVIEVHGGPDRPKDSDSGIPIALLTTVQPGDDKNKMPWPYARAVKTEGTTPIATTVIGTFAR